MGVFYCIVKMQAYLVLFCIFAICYGSILDLTATEDDFTQNTFDISGKILQERDVSTTTVDLPYSFSLAGLQYTIGGTPFGNAVSGLVPADGRNRALSLASFSPENLSYNYDVATKIGSRFRFNDRVTGIVGTYNLQTEYYMLPAPFPVFRSVLTLSLDDDDVPVTGISIFTRVYENVLTENYGFIDFSGNYETSSIVRWVITQQSDPGTGVSYMLLYYSSPTASFYFDLNTVSSPSFPGVTGIRGIGNSLVDLQPGESKSVMLFNAYSTDINFLRSIAFELDAQDLNPRYLVGLTQKQIDSTLNFDLNLATQSIPIPYSHSNLCQISSEVRDRISEERGNKKHFFSEPWFC